MLPIKIRALIADDEPPARVRLRSLLADFSQIQIVCEAKNGDEVVSGIIQHQPDLVLLDINMPGASVFRTIPSLKDPPLVIFQTAYSDHALQAYEIDAVDYLMKPVSRERFARAMAKIEALLESRRAAPDSAQITVKEGEALRVVSINEIERVTFHDGFSFLCLGNEEILCDKSLVSLEEQLKEHGFFQVSRSDIISLAHTVKLHPMFKGQYLAELKSGAKVSVSRRRSGELKSLLGS